MILVISQALPNRKKYNFPFISAGNSKFPAEMNGKLNNIGWQ
jgi:hypothetical protein